MVIRYQTAPPSAAFPSALLADVGVGPAGVLLAEPDAPPGVREYPLQMGLAYLILVGYLVRTLFVSVGLPASVGVIVTGFAFSFFFQAELFAARDQLQELAFFLVLLTAGLEIRLRDLRLFIFVMAFLPATFEMIAIASYAILVLHFTVVEGLVLGTILVAIGDGLVIPKMKEFGVRFEGHPMPRLVFIWAPLEASYALALFGVLTGFADPEGQPEIRVGAFVAGNAMRLVATVCAGACLGGLSGWLVSWRTALRVRGNQVFTGAPVEAFLMVLAVALFAFGLGNDKQVVPVGHSLGSLFQPELVVIMTGIFFAATAAPQVLEEVESVMGGVWVFGQLVLFSMLGSRTTLGIFPQLFDHVFTIMYVGLTFRFLGVFLGIIMTLVLDFSGHPFQWSTVLHDTCFCFLSTIPRATIQGALGQVPVTQRFFQNNKQQSVAQDLIFTAARLYIVCMSIMGMICLNFVGPRLCQATMDRPLWGQARGKESLEAKAAGAEVPGGAPPEPEGREEEECLRRMASGPELLSPPRPQGGPPTPTRPSAEGSERRRHFGRVLGIHAHASRGSHDLDLAQFDCLGSVFKSVTVKEHSPWRYEGP